MKKIITLLCIISFVSFSNAQVLFQSNFQNWTSTTPITPTFWQGSSTTISTWYQWLTGSTYGTYLCGLQNPASSGLGIATQSLNVTAGATYKIEVFVESTQGEMAIGYYDVTSSTYGTVGTYVNVGGTAPSGILVVDSLTLPAGCTSAQFLIYARNTPSFGIGNIGVNLDRVVISFVSGPPVVASPYKSKSIYDIQYTTATSGDSPYEDSLIETTGIVTATYGSGYWIQDSAKAWNGLYVYDNANTPARGDEITIRAEVDEFNNLTELKNIDTVITISTGNTLPTPIGINTTDLSSEEKYEGVLCQVLGATCVNPSAGFGEWDVTNTADTAVIDDLIYAYSPIMSSIYNVTGVVHFSFGEYKLEPRDSLDVIRVSSVSVLEKDELTFDLYPNPASNWLSIQGLNLERAEIYAVSGKMVKSVSLKNRANVDVTDLEKGVYIIRIYSEGETGVSKFIKQ